LWKRGSGRVSRRRTRTSRSGPSGRASGPPLPGPPRRDAITARTGARRWAPQRHPRRSPLSLQELHPSLGKSPDHHLLYAGPGQEHVLAGLGVGFADIQQQPAWLPVADQTRQLPATPGGDQYASALPQRIGDLRHLVGPIPFCAVRLRNSSFLGHRSTRTVDTRRPESDTTGARPRPFRNKLYARRSVMDLYTSGEGNAFVPLSSSLHLRSARWKTNVGGPCPRPATGHRSQRLTVPTRNRAGGDPRRTGASEVDRLTAVDEVRVRYAVGTRQVLDRGPQFGGDS
jgi:hypothetical protein